MILWAVLACVVAYGEAGNQKGDPKAQAVVQQFQQPLPYSLKKPVSGRMARSVLRWIVPAQMLV
jgi:hypothetical protein